MSFFKDLFSTGQEVPAFLERNAAVVDVRTPGEFNQGHVPNSINIPLNEISANKNRIKSLGKPIIFCCASGARSGQATSLMKKEGIECCNGGGWKKVNDQIIK